MDTPGVTLYACNAPEHYIHRAVIRYVPGSLSLRISSKSDAQKHAGVDVTCNVCCVWNVATACNF